MLAARLLLRMLVPILIQTLVVLQLRGCGAWSGAWLRSHRVAMAEMKLVAGSWLLDDVMLAAKMDETSVCTCWLLAGGYVTKL